MAEKVCNECGISISHLPFRVSYCSEAHRQAFTTRRVKAYRRTPENKLKARQRHLKRYIKKTRKSRSKGTNKKKDRELFDKMKHLSKGVFTRSDVQHMTAEQIIKACKSGLRITI